MKKILSNIMIIVIIYTIAMSNTAYANPNWPTTPDVNAKGAIVIEASSGAILYSKNMHKRYYPASITKIMMTLVALENSSMDETVTFSKKAITAIGTDSANLGMKPGEKISMKDALYAAMLKSANECCNAVAETVAGSIEAFVEMMNKKAKELGCSNTHFVTTNGLHDKNHYVSAYDMALITRAAMQNSSFRKITSTKNYTVKATNKTKTTRPFSNHHQMLTGGQYSNTYDGCIGGKTGFTKAARNTLVTIVNKNGMELICVVLKETSDNGNAGYLNQYNDTKKLINKAYDNFKKHNILENEGSSITNDFTSFNKYFQLDTRNNAGYISIAQDSSIVLPNKIKYKAASKKVSFFDNPDIQSGDNIIGTITYTYQNQIVGAANIIMKYYPKGNIANISLPEEMRQYSLLLGGDSSQALTSTKSAFIQGLITVVSLIIVIGLIIFVKFNNAKKRRRNAYRSRRKRSRITFDDRHFR